MNRPSIDQDFLPYVPQLSDRGLSSIDLVVVHCTELPNLQMARQYAERIHYPDSGTGNSGHYYVELSGKIVQWVPLEKTAHHVRGFNERSIGIELDNPGRYPDWYDSRCQVMSTPYPTAQLDALQSLICLLKARIESLEWVAGHEMLDVTKIQATDNPDLMVFRKRDPGPMFPWEEMLPGFKLNLLKA